MHVVDGVPVSLVVRADVALREGLGLIHNLRVQLKEWLHAYFIIFTNNKILCDQLRTGMQVPYLAPDSW